MNYTEKEIEEMMLEMAKERAEWLKCLKPKHTQEWMMNGDKPFIVIKKQ